MTRRCGHENADHLMPGERFQPYAEYPRRCAPIESVTCEQFRCLDCGAWLSLGEANDADPNVELEIEAAAMDHVNPDGLLWAMTLPGGTERTYQALSLAHAIATHDTEGA